MRKILISIVLVIALALGVAACSDDDKTPAATGGSGSGGASGFTPMKAGVLTVGTELPAPPFWIGDDYDSITGGFEYEMAQALAKELGVASVTIVEMPFAGLVAGQECPCDVDFSQISIKPERSEVVEFTVPYFLSDQGVLVKKGTTVKTLDDAKALQWGAQVNTTGLDFIESQIKPTKQAQVYNTTVDAFNALDAGQIQAVLLDTPIVLGQAKATPQLEVVAQFKSTEEYGGAVNKGSANFASINAAMQKLIDNGTVSDLAKKYFGADPSDIPVISVS